MNKKREKNIELHTRIRTVTGRIRNEFEKQKKNENYCHRQEAFQN